MNKGCGDWVRPRQAHMQSHTELQGGGRHKDSQRTRKAQGIAARAMMATKDTNNKHLNFSQVSLSLHDTNITSFRVLGLMVLWIMFGSTVVHWYC